MGRPRVVNPTERKCKRCGDVKPIDDFPKQNQLRDGWFTYRHSCKQCESKRAQVRAELNHEKGKCYCGKDRLAGFARCEQCKEKHDAWRQAHLPEKRKYEKGRTRELKLTVLNHYGHKCFCCGETRYEFLTLDHVGGWGKEHKSEAGTKIQAKTLCLWIIRNNFPDTVRVACYNCNCAMGHHGYCPHEKEREEARLKAPEWNLSGVGFGPELR